MTNSFLPVARTVRIAGSASGLRNIDSLGSILRVSAGPFAEMDRMKADIRSAYIAYVVDTPRIYPGYGRKNRNIGELIKDQLQPDSQVYIIDASDPRFAKHEAAYIEAGLIETSIKLRVPLANRKRPFGRDGHAISPDHEQLVAHARLLLSVAGFGRFDEVQQAQSDLSKRIPSAGNLHGVQILDPETMTIPADATRMRLIRRDIHAEGFSVDDRFHLLPGADYVYADKGWMSEDNRQRRRAIESMEILEPLAGVAGRARLLVGLDCKGAAMAGTILSGEHIGNKVWQAKPDLHHGSPSC